MSVVLWRLGSVLGRAAAVAVRRPVTAVWTTLALACALMIATAAAITAVAVDRWAAAHPGTGAIMVVYLGDGIDPARTTALLGELRALRGVERADLVPAADAANRLMRSLGGDPALLDGIDVASLPPSLEVRLAPGVRDVVAMSPTLRALRGSPGVADVVVEDGGGDPLSRALGTARDLAWTGAALLAGLALVIAIAAVRVGLERDRREDAVLALLGASAGFTVVPSVLAGVLYGACAAVVAVLALAAATHAFSPVAVVAPAPLTALAVLLGLGAGAGGLGGSLAGVARVL